MQDCLSKDLDASEIPTVLNNMFKRASLSPEYKEYIKHYRLKALAMIVAGFLISYYWGDADMGHNFFGNLFGLLGIYLIFLGIYKLFPKQCLIYNEFQKKAVVHLLKSNFFDVDIVKCRKFYVDFEENIASIYHTSGIKVFEGVIENIEITDNTRTVVTNVRQSGKVDSKQMSEVYFSLIFPDNIFFTIYNPDYEFKKHIEKGANIYTKI